MNTIIELSLAAAAGGIVTMAISYVTIGRTLGSLKSDQVGTARNLKECKTLHENCPDTLLKRFNEGVAIQVGALSVQINDVQRRLASIEDHLMNGIKT